MKFIVTILFVAALTGCSSTPSHKDYIGKDAAIVEGSFAGLIGFLGGDAHARVQEIDGIRTPGGVTSFKVSPGVHELGLIIIGDRGTATTYIKPNLQPSKKYRVTGDMTGITAKIRLYDVTSDTQSLVTEERKEITPNAPQPMVIMPVIVK
ncbi:hypothetical protein HMY34_17375 [Thiothrix subterranea]|uniref:hypothetical protein n=1 Tax=Thiothrix subterranea TaxID=2735563 RepID=UPI00192B3D3D|nr:hypothetical protein [Thiothrix subterranea]QQZ30384.1 hypothetical protein HMY34_17375 [Thiothrix subterranea]